MTYAATKDPEELLDYTLDYSPEFLKSTPTDQIASSSWVAIPPTLEIESEQILPPHRAIVWVSGGGVLQSTHKLINTVTTIGGRTYERTILITIRNK